jgi:hypothetical protein
MNNIDTIIIGAGMAGLYYTYKSKLTDYLILEKNDRIGGRIYNIQWNNEQISLGGGVIKETNNNTLALIKELNLESDLVSFTSTYHFIELKGDVPNEKLYHKANKTIINYLRKVYNNNKDEIQNLSLTFKQFLLYYTDYKVYKILHDTILYKSYMDADVGYVLEDENSYELLRVSEFKLKSLKNGGYTLLLNKLLEKLENYKNKIILNCDIIKISKNNQKFIIENSVGNKYSCNKLVIATPKNNNIQFDFDKDLINKINNIYNSVDGKPYIRVYTYHEKGHGLVNSMFTSNIPGKVIIMSDKIIMACYTESINAVELYNLLNKNNKNKESQIDIVYNLLKNSNINVSKPNDIIYQFWDIGTHYIQPNVNYNELKNNIKKLSKENIILIGELFASNHGWVDSALESVINIL